MNWLIIAWLGIASVQEENPDACMKKRDIPPGMILHDNTKKMPDTQSCVPGMLVIGLAAIYWPGIRIKSNWPPSRL